MNKLVRFLLVLLLCHPLLAMAQNDIQLLELTNYVEFHNPDLSTRQSEYYKVVGTPYLWEDFREGKLLTKDHQVFPGMYRYNIHDQEMEFRLDGIIYEVKDKLNIDTLIIDGHRFIYLLAQNKKKDVQGAFYEVLQSGECLLLARKRVELIPGRTRQAYAEPRPPHFTRMPDFYYLQKGVRAPQRITGRKVIREYLSEKDAEIRNFMKQRKVSVRKPEKLAEVVEFYNNLTD